MLVSPGQDIRIYDNGTVSGNFSPSPVLVPGTLPDPLAAVPVPTASGPVRSGCGHGPGIYSSIPTNCALEPGLFVITGGTHIAGHTTIDATAGVTFYLTCGNGGMPQPCSSSGQQGAQVICTGQSTMNVVSQPTDQPAVAGAIPGMAVFFDRSNTGALDCRGTGGSGVVGTIYGARATLRMCGNGECTFDDSLVVVGSVNFSVNPSSFTARYRASDHVQLQGMSALIE